LKKALAILLLFVFLFNVGGYYIVFWVLQHQYSLKIAAIIDSGSYVEEETMELKIPMTLPYPLQPRDFERISGKFEYQGEYFELVKQKLEKDTLHVIVLKNHDEKRLVSTMNQYVKLSNDLPGTEQKAYNFLGKLLKDYNHESKITFIEATTWTFSELKFRLTDASKISLPVKDIPSPPPKA
jgi:hypothetical protein